MSETTDWMRIGSRVNSARKLVRAAEDNLRVARDLLDGVPDPSAAALHAKIELLLKAGAD